jgi:metal-dependent amidase/aminoacylase/carboxypeptidase family protein
MYDSTDGPLDGIAGMGMVGRTFIGASYRGKNAHAGGNPWNGINALDAAVAAYNNISLLRQQIAPNDRIHNVLIESENTVNIIPAYAKAAYQTRSPELDDMKNLTERVCNCIKAASLATGTELELHKEAPYEPILMNPTLCEVYTKAGKENGHNVLKSTPKILTGSTDQGNVSQILPSLHSVFTIHGEKGANPHTALFYQAAGTDDAHNRAIVVGKTLARVGYEILTNDEAYKNVRAEWEAQKKEQAKSEDR